MSRREEEQHQMALMEWARRMEWIVPHLKWLNAHPNGGLRPYSTRLGNDGKTIVRYSVEGQKLKRMGVKPGFPDVSLLVPSGGRFGLFIELKSKTGRLSTEQRAWLTMLNMAGYAAIECVGWERAAREIASYLKPLIGASFFNSLEHSIF